MHYFPRKKRKIRYYSKHSYFPFHLELSRTKKSIGGFDYANIWLFWLRQIWNERQPCVTIHSNLYLSLFSKLWNHCSINGRWQISAINSRKGCFAFLLYTFCVGDKYRDFMYFHNKNITDNTVQMGSNMAWQLSIDHARFNVDYIGKLIKYHVCFQSEDVAFITIGKILGAVCLNPIITQALLRSRSRPLIALFACWKYLNNLSRHMIYKTMVSEYNRTKTW